MFERARKDSFAATLSPLPLLTAGDVMTTGILTVQKDAPISEIANVMRLEDVGAVPVVDTEGELFGIVTDRDLVVRGIGIEGNMFPQTAKDIATTQVVYVDADEALTVVLELMGQRQVRRIPVVDEDLQVVGIIALGDIATRADMDEEVRRALRRISGKRSAWAQRWF